MSTRKTTTGKRLSKMLSKANKKGASIMYCRSSISGSGKLCPICGTNDISFLLHNRYFCNNCGIEVIVN
jgi:hypothetical protein